MREMNLKGRVVRSFLVSLFTYVVGPFGLGLATESVNEARYAYSCEPTRPVFCRNIHVGCAGVTKIKTSPFDLTIRAKAAQIIFADPASSMRGRTELGRDLVIRLENGRDWMRIEPDGRYSHRIYRASGAAMSSGVCTQKTGP